MTLDWRRLLSDKRFRTNAVQPPRAAKAEAFRTPFESDYDRLVYSRPFRRLARKTQVHPLAAHDHVHNRLTHSIEVASVGRSFARQLGRHLVKQNQITDAQVHDLCQIAQAACLAHDIGNPPFGHAGEYAIRQWAADHHAFMFPPSTGHHPGIVADWLIFEGNAQGFRIAARADNPRAGYLRLTFATLGSMIKYPWQSLDERAAAKGKYNAFSSEKDLLDTLAQELGLRLADGRIARHPLSFLTEAADDICYRLLDLEDAVEMKILDAKQVHHLLLAFLGTNAAAHADEMPLAVLRGNTIARLIDQCMAIYIRDEAAIMAGRRVDDLKSSLDSQAQDLLGQIKKIYDTIFAERNKVVIELGAYEILGRIIHTMLDAAQQLSDVKSFARCSFINQKRMELTWGSAYATEQEKQPYIWWLEQVKDYIAGLTDNYARQLSREMAGL